MQASVRLCTLAGDLLTKQNYRISLGLRTLNITNNHLSLMAPWLKQSLRPKHLNLIAAETTSNAHQICVGGKKHLLKKSPSGLRDVAVRRAADTN